MSVTQYCIPSQRGCGPVQVGFRLLGRQLVFSGLFCFLFLFCKSFFFVSVFIPSNKNFGNSLVVLLKKIIQQTMSTEVTHSLVLRNMNIIRMRRTIGSLYSISVYNWKQDCLTEIISNIRRIYDQIVQYIFINDFPHFLLTRSLRKHFDQSCKY